MTAPLIVGTWASEAARKAAFQQAVRDEQAAQDTATREMLAPKPPVMQEITVQARKFPPYILIGVLLLGYWLVTSKDASLDWE